MKRTLIMQALAMTEPQESITVCGWVRTRRDAKEFSFLEINDGSCLANIQCIVDAGTPAFASMADANTGAGLRVTGQLVPSLGKGQQLEISALLPALMSMGWLIQKPFLCKKKTHLMNFLRFL